ncbi:hypothetical protein KR018_007558, partial [Drosophila ironensis]
MRLYFLSIHFIGLMRYRFDKSRNQVLLTPDSVTVARMVGLSLVFCQCHVILRQNWQNLDIMPLLFIIFLLIQPRSAIENRIKLVNSFLKQYQRMPVQPKSGISLSTISLLFYKMFALHLVFMSEALSFNRLTLPRLMCWWIVFITTDLINIGMSRLTNFYKELNDEMTVIAEDIQKAIQGSDHREGKTLQRRLNLIQDQLQACSRIMDQAFKCLGPQLLYMTYLNIWFLRSCSTISFATGLDALFLSMNLRTFIFSLDEFLEVRSTWETIPWRHMIPFVQAEDFFRRHIRPEMTTNTPKDFGWSMNNHQTLMNSLLRPQLKILGLFPPNRRYLFGAVLALCCL